MVVLQKLGDGVVYISYTCYDSIEHSVNKVLATQY